jgi:hypothetical protein
MNWLSFARFFSDMAFHNASPGSSEKRERIKSYKNTWGKSQFFGLWKTFLLYQSKHNSTSAFIFICFGLFFNTEIYLNIFKSLFFLTKSSSYTVELKEEK